VRDLEALAKAVDTGLQALGAIDFVICGENLDCALYHIAYYSA
jgi:hypothetical protein